MSSFLLGWVYFCFPFRRRPGSRLPLPDTPRPKSQQQQETHCTVPEETTASIWGEGRKMDVAVWTDLMNFNELFNHDSHMIISMIGLTVFSGNNFCCFILYINWTIYLSAPKCRRRPSTSVWRRCCAAPLTVPASSSSRWISRSASRTTTPRRTSGSPAPSSQ